jgi:hypothetical protein
MPDTRCPFGICMSTSLWILLVIGVTVLSVGIVFTLAQALSSLGTGLTNLGASIWNLFVGVLWLLACGALAVATYWVLVSTLPPGTLPTISKF